MKEALLDFFRQYPNLALATSIAISILVAVLGLVPSVFVTAANLLFFGFWEGILVSFLGEALGAVVAFYLYRKGFKKEATHQLEKHKKVKALLEAEDKKAFWLIFSLRLVPFVPSGLVTFAAAIGRVSAPTFFVASSLGKVPALLLEGYAVYEVTAFGWQGKVILTVVALILLYFVARQVFTSKK
ncbi:TVP38/TMEM64 family protein [Flavisolibacter nicotianae]|uniref:TVP38/TMEM64 family protein n=1 Tax=Flavisolibacter nicotianae TaxID=2364882 RepID=UPI000EB2F130|nr:VTT domain-containing protein [Flavisolibacter nicotianae]